MKYVVIYYDGNSTLAKLVELDESDNPMYQTPLGFNLVGADMTINAIIEVHLDSEHMIAHLRDDNALVVTKSLIQGQEDFSKVLDLEEID